MKKIIDLEIFLTIRRSIQCVLVFILIIDKGSCPAGICLLKLNNRNTTFKVNNKVVLVFLLFTLNIFRTWSGVSIVNFEHVIAGWVVPHESFKTIPVAYLETAKHL